MKAADIPDAAMLEVVNELGLELSGAHWAFIWDIAPRFEPMPEKVVRAKLRNLKKRGLLDGCDCGCRGDWELTRAGAEALSSSRRLTLPLTP